MSLADALRAAGQIPRPSLHSRAVVAIWRAISRSISNKDRCCWPENLPVGVVTEIAGNSRFWLRSRANRPRRYGADGAIRHDAAAAAAEIILMVEHAAHSLDFWARWAGLRSNGAINLIPGRCELSLDIRSGNDAAARGPLVISCEYRRHRGRRGVTAATTEVLDAAAVPCSTRLQEAFAASIARAGSPCAAAERRWT